MESIINFSVQSSLEAQQRDEAKRRFYSIIEKFTALKDGINGGYNRCLLVQYTYEYSLSVESKDMFLYGNEDIDFSDKHLEKQLREAFIDFADYLLNNFFFLLQRTLEGEQEFTGTPDRISSLRGACLIQDRHRCVISRKFDFKKTAIARNDDGALLKADLQAFETLKVMYILLHSLMKIEDDSELTSTKKAVIAILNVFNSDVAHVIEGCEIDRSFNATSLTPTLHSLFEDFQILFEPVSTELPHTYTISSHLPPLLLRDSKLPVTRELYLSEDRSIDPSLPRLLAIHSAIAHILHLFAAGEYIDRLLRDQE
ncbi:hypothetical protein AJ78_00906 [Emergomyces pasteurianus Ep9510]|uniref:HNH nuclease domain-containing protein n=1 Tax=Emergomyces pasteurianus Ep9510 TaxID=1447872 RepID=A0A1J9PRQ0_9EURO|nr:hypothetical protein AJ78_00906 [Emergomyces pasteurianus Ep9510]